MRSLRHAGWCVSFGACLALLTGCGRSARRAEVSDSRQKQPVEVVTVSRRDLVESLSLVGSLAPNETAQLRAEISGIVRDVQFDEGGHVAKGQVLLKIDDAELRAQLAQAEAHFRLAELNFKRSENLTEARSLSQAEADRTRSEYASAEAEVQLLRVRLDKMEIKAPFDGIVGARPISPGDYVTAATVITTLDDLSRLKIDFQVPERFAAKVVPGTGFRIRLQAAGEATTAGGRVYFVSSIIDRATRSMQVKGYVDDPPPTIKPGMFANVDLVLDVRRNVLAVPEGAVLTTATGSSLVIVRTGEAGTVADYLPVALGLRARGYVEVRGLKAALDDGQQIVASGVGGLNVFPGTLLDPRPLKEEFRLPD